MIDRNSVRFRFRPKFRPEPKIRFRFRQGLRFRFRPKLRFKSEPKFEDSKNVTSQNNLYFTNAVAIVIPADGPSFGIAAAGK